MYKINFEKNSWTISEKVLFRARLHNIPNLNYLATVFSATTVTVLSNAHLTALYIHFRWAI